MLKKFVTFKFAGISLGSVFLSAAMLFSQNPSALFTNQFERIDSIIAAFEGSVDLGKCDSASAAASLSAFLYQHPGFSAAAVCGGNGDILASAAFEGMVGEVSGNVSEKEWFKKASEAGKPYYSDVVRINSRYCLIWSRPVYSSALGLTTRRGIFTIFVNIGECLKDFSVSFRRPFELLRNGILFYHTDDWHGDLPYTEEPVTLMGNVAFALRYSNAPLPEANLGGVTPDSGSAATSMPRAAAAAREVRHNDSVFLNERFPPRVPYRRAQPLFFIWGVIAVAAVIVLLSILVVFRIREREKKRARSGVLADMYREIRARIERAEITAIEKEARESLRREIGERIRREQADIISEELRASLLEEAKAAVREEIREQISNEEPASLRQEARAMIIAEVVARLRDQVGGALEIEALQELTKTVKGEVRAEHENSLKERAIRELEERIQREVAIRERSMLLMQARAALKLEIEKEVREREAPSLRAEIRTVQREKRLNQDPATRTMDRERIEQVEKAMQRIEKSEEIVSLAKTVEILKSQGRSSPAFSLNAAQTASMIEYLERLSAKLGNRFADIIKAVRTMYCKPKPDASAASADVNPETGGGAAESSSLKECELAFADELRESHNP